MSKDFVIGVTGTPTVSNVLKKPSYLITLEAPKGKSKIISYFITIDKPDLQVNFIQAKGFYSELDEDDIVNRFADIVRDTAKENIMEMMFPTHRIFSIRSLVFNANKQSTLIR